MFKKTFDSLKTGPLSNTGLKLYVNFAFYNSRTGLFESVLSNLKIQLTALTSMA